jgi:cytochrome c oxidase subunit 2
MQGQRRELIWWIISMLVFIVILYFVNELMLRHLPEEVSTFAREIDTVFYVIYYITGFVFLLVTALLMLFLIRYRYKPGQRAVYSHGNTALELVWTAIPAAVFIILFLISQSTWARVKYRETMPRGDVEVRVTAKQFNWDFLYPGPDGKFDTEDDKAMSGELHVPVRKVVRITLQAEDVIHSFFVPVFRLKQDAVPGHTIPVWFQASKTGRFEIPCAELCGPGHSGMKAWLTVHADDEYQQWVQEQWQ